MSLINDALRRARQAQQEPVAVTGPPDDTVLRSVRLKRDNQPEPTARTGPPDRAAQPPPLEPVEPPPPSPWPRMAGAVLAVSLCVVLAGAGAWFLWSGWRSERTVVAFARPLNRPVLADQSTNQITAKTNFAAGAVTTSFVASATSALAGAASQPTNAPAPMLPKAPAAPAPVAVKWPVLKLQGIFYRPSDPSVVINNKTLYLDDTIEGVKVVDIKPQRITVALGGQTNFMVLR